MIIFSAVHRLTFKLMQIAKGAAELGRKPAVTSEGGGVRSEQERISSPGHGPPLGSARPSWSASCNPKHGDRKPKFRKEAENGEKFPEWWERVDN